MRAKTTISTNLARSLQKRGHKVLLVDTDHAQASARDWHAAKEDNPLPCIALDRPNNFKSLTSVATSYDFVVVDGAAKLEKQYYCHSREIRRPCFNSCTALPL